MTEEDEEMEMRGKIKIKNKKHFSGLFLSDSDSERVQLSEKKPEEDLDKTSFTKPIIVKPSNSHRQKSASVIYIF